MAEDKSVDTERDRDQIELAISYASKGFRYGFIAINDEGMQTIKELVDECIDMPDRLMKKHDDLVCAYDTEAGIVMFNSAAKRNCIFNEFSQPSQRALLKYKL